MNGEVKTSTCKGCIHSTGQTYHGTPTGYYTCSFQKPFVLRAGGRLCNVGRWEPISLKQVPKRL